MFGALCRMDHFVWCRHKLSHSGSHRGRSSLLCQSATFGASHYIDTTSAHFGNQPRFYAMALAVSFAPFAFEHFSGPCSDFFLHAYIGVAASKEDSQVGFAVWSGVGARKATLEASRKQSTPPILLAACCGIHSTSGRTCRIMLCRNARSLLCTTGFSFVARLGFAFICDEPGQVERATILRWIYRVCRWEAVSHNTWTCIRADSQARLLIADSLIRIGSVRSKNELCWRLGWVYTEIIQKSLGFLGKNWNKHLSNQFTCGKLFGSNEHRHL